MKIIRWFISLFTWRDVADVGVWTLRENTLTGERDIVRTVRGGHSPYPARWITEGEVDPINIKLPDYR